MEQKNYIRINEVDGIRGWASLCVLVFHTFKEMLSFAVPSVHNSLLAPFFSAGIAVDIFFVLSGDALSSAFLYGKGNGSIDRLLVRRYFRLTIPIFMSCLITYCIMVMHFDYHMAASAILQRPDWLGDFLQFNASFFKFLRYALLGVYVAHTRELSYNPFLWTMSVEMAGSMLVFLFCYLWPRLRSPQWVCFGLIIWLTIIGSLFALFFAGVLLGYLRQQGYLDKLLQDRMHKLLATGIVIGVAGMLIATSGINLSGAFLPLMLLVSMLLVFSFYTQSGFKAFFSNKLSHFLGDISFPLYLVHFQVLISLMSWLVVRDYALKGVIDQGAMLRFACISVAASLFIAWCFRQTEKFVLKRVDAIVLKILS